MSQFELPVIECIEETDTYGVMTTCEPHLPKGFGITIGNALRRVLLNALPGIAVTWVKIEGVHHGFTTIPHMKEDTIEFLLSVRALRLMSLMDNWPARMLLEVAGEKKGRIVTAADIKPLDGIEVVNTDLHLASLDSSKARLSVEFNVEKGVGYRVASDDNLPVDAIPVDAIFTPIRGANYKVEPVHTAEGLDCEKLVIEIWTDGTIAPLRALNKGAQILADCLEPFINASIILPVEVEGQADSIPADKYDISVEDLSLSGRVVRSLMRNHITTVGEVLEKTDDELLKLSKFGRKSLEELKACLDAAGLTVEQPGKALVEEAEIQKEPTLQDKYNIPLESLGLSGRVLSLMKEHVSTVGELLEKTDGELLELPKFGRKSLEDVKKSLLAGGFIDEEMGGGKGVEDS